MQTTVSQRTTFTDVTMVNQSFFWMCIGLVITGFSSFFVASNQTLTNALYSNSILFYGLSLAELALVFFLSLRITKMSYASALLSFLVYSFLNGITLSAIFLIYTRASIASTFFITA